MKITASPPHAQPTARHHPVSGRGSVKPEAAAPTPSTVVTPRVAEVARKAPPGLERVAARLESLGAEGRSPGQDNALTRIQRNLQRYLDNQGIVPTAPAPAPAPAAPVEEAPATDPTATVAPSPAPAEEPAAA